MRKMVVCGLRIATSPSQGSAVVTLLGLWGSSAALIERRRASPIHDRQENNCGQLLLSGPGRNDLRRAQAQVVCEQAAIVFAPTHRLETLI